MKNQEIKKKKSAGILPLAVVSVLLILSATTVLALSRWDWHLDNGAGGLARVNRNIGGAVSEAEKSVDWDYFDDAVMVGDSITYGMASYGYLTFDHVFAKIGLHQGTALNGKCVYKSKTDGYTIAEALAVARPGKIFVTLGINAIYSHSTDSFYDNYRALLKKIKKASPESVILVQSIFPVTESWAQNNGKPRCNEHIAAANERLAALAQEESCYFLYTYEVLSDKNGFLQSAFSGDGIHLSKKGYSAVFDYILSHPVNSNGKFVKFGAITPPPAVKSGSSQISMPDIGPISKPSPSSEKESSGQMHSSSGSSSNQSHVESNGSSSGKESSSAASSHHESAGSALSSKVVSSTGSSSDRSSSKVTASSSSGNTSAAQAGIDENTNL